MNIAARSLASPLRRVSPHVIVRRISHEQELFQTNVELVILRAELGVMRVQLRAVRDDNALLREDLRAMHAQDAALRHADLRALREDLRNIVRAEVMDEMLRRSFLFED